MNLKTLALKLATLGTLAATFFVASPARANAQVSLGVRVGGPVYPYGHVRPVYGPYGGYGYRPYYGYPHYYGRPYGYGYHREFRYYGR